jgi:hypothetical protein
VLGLPPLSPGGRQEVGQGLWAVVLTSSHALVGVIAARPGSSSKWPMPMLSVTRSMPFVVRRWESVTGACTWGVSVCTSQAATSAQVSHEDETVVVLAVYV